MYKKILYFSGTGNSLAVAREIAEQIGKCDITNMARFIGQKIEVDEEVIGFVFPVYFQDIPRIVKEFINNMEFKNNPYIFGITTHNGEPGFTLFNLDKILKFKEQKLSSGFTLTMPGNSVIIMDLTSNSKIQKERLTNSKIKVEQMSKIIKKELEVGIEGKKRIRDKLKGFILNFISTKMYNAPKKFAPNEKCTLCGNCQRICPENNIKMDKKVVWGSNCALCLACFHWCPQKGVEIGNSTKRRIRYHHPNIKLSDMVLR